jgi:hypothetical protein
MKKQLLKLAEYLGPRPTNEEWGKQKTSIIVPSIIIGLFFISLFALGYNSYHEKIKILTSAILPLVSTEQLEWKVYFDDIDAGCDKSKSQVNLDCPAHPKNTKLWQSPLSHSDSENNRRLEERREKIFGTALRYQKINYF